MTFYSYKIIYTHEYASRVIRKPLHIANNVGEGRHEVKMKQKIWKISQFSLSTSCKIFQNESHQSNSQFSLFLGSFCRKVFHCISSIKFLQQFPFFLSKNNCCEPHEHNAFCEEDWLIKILNECYPISDYVHLLSLCTWSIHQILFQIFSQIVFEKGGRRGSNWRGNLFLNFKNSLNLFTNVPC